MPEISRFYGIVIRMFHREHAPPHLHAQHGEYEITVDIESLIIRGQCPGHVIRRVQLWTNGLHGRRSPVCQRIYGVAPLSRPVGGRD
ncbi:MAG: DUF4160 domain-containing protein [Gemmatimonadales bacterium]